MADDALAATGGRMAPEPHPRAEHGRGATVWLTGLSGAGKTTIGDTFVRRLHDEGYDHFRLDADDLRDGLCADLGFSAEDRAENVRRIGEVTLLFASRGHFSVVSVISPYAAGRAAVRARTKTRASPSSRSMSRRRSRSANSAIRKVS